MSDLLEIAVNAHGGLARFNESETVRAHLSLGGVLLPVKGQTGYLDDVNVRVDLHRQFTSHSPFGEPGVHTAFTGNHIALENEAGEVVEELANPRDSFADHTFETPWTRLQTAYFLGYAIWTYMTSPFVFTTPGFRTEELSPWQENGETWRRLKVEFPDNIVTHNKEQIFYIGQDGLIKRHDYTAEVVKGGLSAHYMYDYQKFDGIMIPTKQPIYVAAEDGSVALDPLVVSIDLSDVKFS